MRIGIAWNDQRRDRIKIKREEGNRENEHIENQRRIRATTGKNDLLFRASLDRSEIAVQSKNKTSTIRNGQELEDGESLK